MTDRGVGALQDDGFGTLGVATILGVGVFLGVLELQHVREMSTSLGVVGFALVPLAFDTALLGAAYLLWNSRLDGGERARIAGWVVLGAIVLGLLAAWTIAHQDVRGLPFAHGLFVTASSSSVGGVIGFVLGWYDARKRHHDREVAALHVATRDLIHAKDREAVARAVTEAARDVLDFPSNVVRLRDGDRLRPVSVTSDAREELGERPVYDVDEGLPGRALSDGGSIVIEDFRELADGYDRHPHRSALYVPLGDHGTLSIGDGRPGAFEESDVMLATILANNAASVLDRLERERELKQKNERLDQFASMVSHDLRNPLSIARGRLGLYRKEGDESDLDAVERALSRIEGLTEDLTGLARHGRASAAFEPFSLADCARDAWSMIDSRSATLSVEDVEIDGDEGQVRALLENLFRNAIGHGGADVAVRVGPLPDGFFVEDTGDGVPADVRDRVFDHGFTTGYGGSGVGLTIVERIASAHDLGVTLCESPEGGARFEFRESTAES